MRKPDGGAPVTRVPPSDTPDSKTFMLMGRKMIGMRKKSEERLKSAIRQGQWNAIARNWEIYLFLLPAILYMLVFVYKPMYGVLIAFKDFRASKGILGSPWAANYGFAHFLQFFRAAMFQKVLTNTLLISFYSLIVGFPLPLILALSLNASRVGWLKKTNQMITYMPHFISTVVMVGIINVMFSPQVGIIARILNETGLADGYLMVLIDKSAFIHLYVWTGVWQNMGWGSILYLAALSAVDPELHEAALCDGATRLKRVWHIDLPSILPTIIILLILNIGHLMSVGYEKIFLMQNALNESASEVISTYVFKRGLLNAEYSYSAAVGLFNNVVNIILLIMANTLARRASSTSLF